MAAQVRPHGFLNCMPVAPHGCADAPLGFLNWELRNMAAQVRPHGFLNWQLRHMVSLIRQLYRRVPYLNSCTTWFALARKLQHIASPHGCHHGTSAPRGSPQLTAAPRGFPQLTAAPRCCPHRTAASQKLFPPAVAAPHGCSHLTVAPHRQLQLLDLTVDLARAGVCGPSITEQIAHAELLSSSWAGRRVWPALYFPAASLYSTTSKELISGLRALWLHLHPFQMGLGWYCEYSVLMSSLTLQVPARCFM